MFSAVAVVRWVLCVCLGGEGASATPLLAREQGSALCRWAGNASAVLSSTPLSAPAAAPLPHVEPPSQLPRWCR
jgi:hypothetical protein